MHKFLRSCWERVQRQGESYGNQGFYKINVLIINDKVKIRVDHKPIQVECSNFGIVPLVVGKIEMVWIRFTVTLKSVGVKNSCNRFTCNEVVGSCAFLTSLAWRVPFQRSRSRWSALAVCHPPSDLFILAHKKMHSEYQRLDGLYFSKVSHAE